MKIFEEVSTFPVRWIGIKEFMKEHLTVDRCPQTQHSMVNKFRKLKIQKLKIILPATIFKASVNPVTEKIK